MSSATEQGRPGDNPRPSSGFNAVLLPAAGIYVPGFFALRRYAAGSRATS